MENNAPSATPHYEIKAATYDYTIFVRADYYIHSHEFPYACVSLNYLPEEITENECIQFFKKAWYNDRNKQWVDEYFKYLRYSSSLTKNMLEKFQHITMLDQQSKLLAERLRKKEEKSDQESQDFKKLSKLDLPNPLIIESLKAQKTIRKTVS